MKIINITFLLIVLSFFAKAQSNTHTVEAGQTFYAIAKMYNTTVDQIKANNPNIDQNNIVIGTVLNIYTQPSNSSTSYTSGSSVTNSPIYHTVAKGETLFGLAKRTYNVSIDDVKRWNNLVDNTLSVGQNLIIGYANETQSYSTNTTTYTTTANTSTYKAAQSPTVTTTSTKPAAEGRIVYTSTVPNRGDLTDLKGSRTVYTSTVPSTTAISSSPDKYTNTTITTTVPQNSETNVVQNVDNVVNNTTENVETESMITKKYGSIATGGKLLPREIFKTLETSDDPSLVFKKEEGVAKWFELDDKGIQIYAMHHSAPIGSALKITNPINQTTIYVKVIDMLTPTNDNDNTVIRLSSNAMSILKMFDKAFMVNVEYFDIVDK